MTAKAGILLLILVVGCTVGFADKQTNIFEGIELREGPIDLGILFSTNDILLDLELRLII